MCVMCQGVLAFTRDETKSCKTEFPGENDACKRLFLFFSESRFFCNSPDRSSTGTTSDVEEEETAGEHFS